MDWRFLFFALRAFLHGSLSLAFRVAAAVRRTSLPSARCSDDYGGAVKASRRAPLGGVRSADDPRPIRVKATPHCRMSVVDWTARRSLCSKNLVPASTREASLYACFADFVRVPAKPVRVGRSGRSREQNASRSELGQVCPSPECALEAGV